MNTKLVGNKGEALAEAFLKDNGYKILDRNYKLKFGEIDLIAEKDNIISFVEVKYRSTNMFGLGREAVNYKKQTTIKKVAELYLLNKKLTEKDISFDVIELKSDDEIEHIKNCF